MTGKNLTNIDLRTKVTIEIDVVLTAKSKALGVDKSVLVRDVLAKWVADELSFVALLHAEQKNTEERQQRSRRRHLSQRQKNAVFARDGLKCKSCGAEPEIDHLHIDHVIPVNAGGSSELSNLQVLCRPCNLQKANKILPFSPGEGASGRHG
jgi:hypothetical protein